MITAETLTDEQIQELLLSGKIDQTTANNAMRKVSGTFTWDRARAKCAALINAQTADSDPPHGHAFVSMAAVEAIRKESFVQGWIRSRANSMGQDLADFDDETILEWLPFADEAYRKYRKHRS